MILAKKAFSGFKFQEFKLTEPRTNQVHYSEFVLLKRTLNN